MSYELDPEEITKINKHISNWERLVPGTKIKLPGISNQLSEEINEVEPFIEDYYPKVEIPIKEETNLNHQEEFVFEDNTIESTNQTKEDNYVSPSIKYDSKKKKNIMPYNSYYPYYMYPNPYMYNSYYNRGYHIPPKKRSR